MAEISGSVIKPADFRSSDSQAVLRINRNIINNTFDSIKVGRQHIGEVLAKAIRRSHVFDAVLIERPSVSLEADEASLISLSVKLLIELLANAPKLTTFTGTTPTSPAARLIVEIAESNGWCAKQAINYFLSYDYTMLNYLATMKRGPSTRHKARREDGGQMCIAYEVREGYITRHVKDSCKTCQPSGGSADDLMGPDVALSSSDGEGGGSVGADILRSRTYCTYCPISEE